MFYSARIYDPRTPENTICASYRLTGPPLSAMVGCMPRTMLPHSAKKFLRTEKARIRREITDPAEAAKRIAELVAKIRHGYTIGA